VSGLIPERPEAARTRNLPRWSLRNKTLVLLAVLFFGVWGAVSYINISRREDPEIKISIALVVTIYPGASAAKVEEQVTRKLEDHLEGLPHLHHLSSTTRANLSVIFVHLDYEADTDVAWQKLRARVGETRKELPEGVIGPDVIDNFGDTTSMLIALTGAAPPRLAELARELRAELRRVAAVGEVAFHGEQPEAVYLEGSAAQLARSGVTPYQIAQALKLRNLRIPAGAIRTGRYEYRVEPSGAYRTLPEIEGTVLDVSRTSGQPLHVRDLFRARRAVLSPAETKVEKNGEGAIAIGVVMRKGHNVVAMGKEVRAVLDQFRARLPAGVGLEVVHDSPRQVSRHVGNFMRNLLEGLVIVLLCMGIFLGWRPALISATAIPLSVLVALALMPLLKIDLELVSIAAFIIALGMLVDDNIIIVDNVDVKLREGAPPAEAAWRGTHELTAPVIVGTLSNCIAFVPMLLLSNEVGAYVRSLPLVLSASLLASMLIAFTVAPLCARYLLRRPAHATRPAGAGRGAELYRRMVRACLRHRWQVLVYSLLALIGAGVALVATGFSFFPEAERDQFTVDIWLKEGSSIEETERIARQADAELRRDPEVASTLLYLGKGGPRFYITVMPELQTANFAQIMVNTRSAAATPRVVDRFNQRARSAYAGARVFAKKLIMGMPIEAPVALRVSGPELTTLHHLSRQLQEILRRVPGTDQVRDNVGEDIPSLRVEVDDERASRVGVTHTDVALTFLASYQGFELTRFTEGDREIPIILRLRESDRQIGADLSQLPVASTLTGEKVPLSSVARVVPQWGPGVIRRFDNRRCITVLAWTEGRLASDVLREAWPKVSALRLPPGYRIEISGEKEELDRAFKDLLIVFAVILSLLITVLLVQLGSLRRALVVLTEVPLALIGAALGLYLGGYSFSFMAFLGCVAVSGMVIKNSVIWLDFVERARAQGRSVEDAVIEARIYRLRPIMLTTATTLGGLFPLALAGGVLFEPMAWAMIAGLGLATVLTMFLVPVYYRLIMPDEEPRAPEQGE